jgi:hypothetical protein
MLDLREPNSLGADRKPLPAEEKSFSAGLESLGAACKSLRAFEKSLCGRENHSVHRVFHSAEAGIDFARRVFGLRGATSTLRGHFPGCAHGFSLCAGHFRICAHGFRFAEPFSDLRGRRLARGVAFPRRAAVRALGEGVFLVQAAWLRGRRTAWSPNPGFTRAARPPPGFAFRLLRSGNASGPRTVAALCRAAATPGCRVSRRFHYPARGTPTAVTPGGPCR